MAMSIGRLAIAAAAFAGLAAGGLGTWFLLRATAPPPEPPPAYVNPLADAVKDEVLVLGRGDGSHQTYRVLDADPWTVLLSIESAPSTGPSQFEQVRVARSFFGLLLILEGDIPPDLAVATVRDFALESCSPVRLFVPALGRTLRCWKFTGGHRSQVTMTIWVSDEVPVHGVVRMDSAKGKIWELTGIAWPGGK